MMEKAVDAESTMIMSKNEEDKEKKPRSEKSDSTNEDVLEEETTKKTESEAPKKVDGKDSIEQSEKKVKKEGSDAAEAASSDDEDGDSARRFRIDSGLLPFPEKLMALLDGKTVSDAMWWLPDGDAFCIIPSVFAQQVLDKHFSGTKFESFTRKLNRWGFKRVAGQKVPANTIAYYNKHFLRGKPKLLKNMNGGKTKFVSAREKRMRAQLKRDRDREQAVLGATQQQQQSLFNRAGVTGAMDPFAGLMGGVGAGAAGLFGGGAAGLLGGAGASNPSHLQALLASRQMLLQRQAEEMRIAEHVLAAEFSAQKQREELMRLYGQQGGQGGAMSDPTSSNSFLRAGAFPPQLQGSSSVSSSGAMGVEELLAARQQMATGNLIDRLLAERMANNNNSSPDGPASLMQQQRLEEQGSSHSSRQIAKDDSSHHSESKGSPPPAGVTGTNATGQIDPELFKLYLLEQERKRRGL